MKILVTGTHFTPAVAVIEELQKQYAEIIYIGRNHTMEGDKASSVESQILPKMGVKFYSLTAGRLRRYPSIGTLISLFKIPIGFIQAFYLVATEQPGVVLAFGGYVAVPVVVCAWLLNIPIITHEQTLVSGLSNRICGIFAKKICVSFDIKYDFPESKVILTGNPIRAELLSAKTLKHDLPLVVILGGNQGAHIINEKIGEIVGELIKTAQVVHQTGDSHFRDFEKLIEIKKTLENSERYEIKKWIDVGELGSLLKSADLVISRAGANTLLELAYFGIPTLLIPLPHLYKDEQNINAKYFKSLGLAEILSQDSGSKKLLDQILDMLKNRQILKKQAGKAKSIVIVDAAKRVALEAITLK